MPIRAIESQRLYQQIAGQLSALIASGEFPLGQRLPSERELAALLGVSRTSVREALLALQIAGRVDIRMGMGAFASNPYDVAVASPGTDGQGPFELLRARGLIEGETAAAAARNGSTADLAAVRATAETADRDFHLGIATATHNSALVSVVRDLWDRGWGAISKRMDLHLQTPERLAAAVRDHRAILVALEARDERGARAAMRRHLARVERELLRGWVLLEEREAVSRRAQGIGPVGSAGQPK
jgi:DNA-binding FadR family transcriptional regulator